MLIANTVGAIYEIFYVCDDGTQEFWGEAFARSPEDACTQALLEEHESVDGHPMKYVASPTRIDAY
jgi:hypothetical protein